MTNSKIISLPERMSTIRQGRLERILASLNLDMPLSLGQEVGTGDLVATPEEWGYFESLFSAFMAEMPVNIKALNAIGAAIYLSGTIGSNIKLRLTNEDVYHRVKGLLTAKEQAYIEALFTGALNAPAELIEQMGVFEKLPSDFV